MSRSRKTRFNHKPAQKVFVRETPNIPSAEIDGCNTSAKNNQQYTGSYVIGIGQLHKSNAVPVTCNSDAVDIAKMRRN